jgi:tetratricopeptide (TPR) repeat protein
MLLDRGLLTQDGSRYVVTTPISHLEVPETLHALVAARLDNLDVTERALLQDAAVLGMSFPTAALAAVSGRPELEVRSTLDRLVAKQVLGREQDRRAAEAGQYHFLQALLRTIALATLSRRDRKARHLAAAEHISKSWGEAPEIAEVLASHYLDAVAADPEAADADEIRARAKETLAEAGRRAVSLALGTEARHHFERAAELAGDEGERANLLAEAGAAAARTADREAARALLGDAIEVLDGIGRTEDAGRTRARLADVLIDENRLVEAAALMDRARDALTDPAVLAELAARRGRVAVLTGEFGRAYQEAETALRIADPRRIRPVIADAAMNKAIALIHEDRATEALSLLTLGLEVAVDADLTDQALRGYYNLGILRVIAGNIEKGLELIERGRALARERGIRTWERDLQAQLCGICVMLGRWDEALELAEHLRVGAADDSERIAWCWRPLIYAARGQRAELEAWLEQPRLGSEWQELALIEKLSRATALRATGNAQDALPLMVEVADSFDTLTEAFYEYGDELVDALLEAGRTDLLENHADPDAIHAWALTKRGPKLRARGAMHLQRGEVSAAERAFARGLEAFRVCGGAYARGRLLLDYGALVWDLGRAEEAMPLLEEARSVFADLGARPWLERVAAVLPPAAADDQLTVRAR